MAIFNNIPNHYYSNYNMHYPNDELYNQRDYMERVIRDYLGGKVTKYDVSYTTPNYSYVDYNLTNVFNEIKQNYNIHVDAHLDHERTKYFFDGAESAIKELDSARATINQITDFKKFLDQNPILKQSLGKFAMTANLHDCPESVRDFLQTLQK